MMKITQLILSNGHIISDNKIQEHKDIHIINGTINNITNHTNSKEIPINSSNTAFINLDGKYILPGFIDCHVHLILDGSIDIISYVQKEKEKFFSNANHHLKQYIRNGVTTIRDMGDSDHIVSTIKKTLTANNSKPTIIHAGDMLSSEKGHVKTISTTITNNDALIARTIKNQVDHHSDLIKLIISGGILTPSSKPTNTELSADIIKKTVQIAQAHHLATATHAYNDFDINNAIDAGVRLIEHGIFASEKTLQKAAKKSVIITPTIKAVHDILDHQQLFPDYLIENALLIKDAIPDFITNALNQNVPIAMGTDAGTPCNYHGENLKELMYLSQYGLTNWDCINAASTIASRVIQRPSFGSIKPGNKADCIIFDKNPIDDISNVLKNPYLIIKNGTVSSTEKKK